MQVRDPVHHWITATPNERQLINSSIVQRLRWVRQLSPIDMVFNGGTHSRLSHSLGAMKISGDYMTHLFETSPQFRKIANKIQNQIRKTKKLQPASDAYKHYITLARIAGLLHDIGHAPFSHAAEDIFYPNETHGHDHHRLRLIQHQLLKPHIEKCGIQIHEIEAVWEHKVVIGSEGSAKQGLEDHIYSIISAVVQGPMGADRIDFTLRDSWSTGTEHLGTIAQRRIISCSGVRLTPEGRLQLYYDCKVLGDIIRALDGRMGMYKDVYWHKTGVAATLLIREIFNLVARPLNLLDLINDPDEFQYLNDTTIQSLILNHNISELGQQGVDLIQARKLLLKGLMQRNLPKLHHEEMVPATVQYVEQDYVDKWFSEKSKDHYRIVKTRVIACISPQKFDKYNIKFRTTTDKLISCQQALENIK